MRSHNVKVALALYFLLSGLALALGFVRGEPNLYLHPAPLLGPLALWIEVPLGIVLGLGIGLAVVWLTQRAVRIWRWGPAVRLHVGLRHLLAVSDEPLGEAQVVALALSSAVAEELLFRGLLLPLVGLLASSVLFGCLHFVPGQRMRLWVPMAVVMGLALGGLFELLGGLSGPITAHLVINYLNLRFISDYDPSIASPNQGPAR